MPIVLLRRGGEIIPTVNRDEQPHLLSFIQILIILQVDMLESMGI